MGQTYTVEATLKFKNNNPRTFCANIYTSLLTTLHDLKPTDVDVTDPLDCFRHITYKRAERDGDFFWADFDGSYSWEGVMYKAFIAGAKGLDDGSIIEIWPDEGKTTIEVKGGRVYMDGRLIKESLTGARPPKEIKMKKKLNEDKLQYMDVVPGFRLGNGQKLVSNRKPLAEAMEFLKEADNPKTDKIMKSLDQALRRGKKIMLSGASGSGKTAIVKKWAKNKGIDLYTVNCVALGQDDLGGSSNDLDFSGHDVVLLDELDRAPKDVLAKLVTADNKGLIIATVVDDTKLDPAVVGRFDEVINTGDTNYRQQTADDEISARGYTDRDKQLLADDLMAEDVATERIYGEGQFISYYKLKDVAPKTFKALGDLEGVSSPNDEKWNVRFAAAQRAMSEEEEQIRKALNIDANLLIAPDVKFDSDPHDNEAGVRVVSSQAKKEESFSMANGPLFAEDFDEDYPDDYDDYGVYNTTSDKFDYSNWSDGTLSNSYDRESDDVNNSGWGDISYEDRSPLRF